MIIISIKIVNTLKSDNTSNINPITAKAIIITTIKNPVPYFTNLGR